MIRSFGTAKASRARSGQVVLETLLVMPILVTLLGAGIVLAMLHLAEQKVDEASGLGARVGSVGGTDADIQAAIRRALGERWAYGSTFCVSRTETTTDGTPIIVVKVTLQACYVIGNIHVIGICPDRIILKGQTVMRIE